MKRIACLRDLEQCTAGAIDLLTGEADALGYRVLCDLTREGAALLCEVYGATVFAENWNHGREDDPHVASAMLSDHAHLDIAPVLLARTCHTVFHRGGGFRAGGRRGVPARRVRLGGEQVPLAG